MAGCSPRQSLRNRFLIAMLPFAQVLFRIQDVVYWLIGKTNWGIRMHPPAVPMSQAVPFAPEHGYIRGRHGYRLFYRAWPAQGPVTRAALVALDGMGSDAVQFHPIGSFLAPRDIAFFGLDLQGQGMSEGPRSDWTLYPQIVDGIADTILYLGQRFPNTPVYLLGESIGAPLALKLATRRSRPANLAGLILSSPELDPTRLTAKGRLAAVWIILKQVPYFFFASKAPSVDIAGRQKLVARGPEVYRRSVHNPLHNNCVSIRTLAAVMGLIAQMPAMAARTMLPTLVLEAACDQVDDPRAAASFMPCLATGDKELVYFAGAAHGLFYDPDTPRVLRVIGAWLDDHLGRWKVPPQQCGAASSAASAAASRSAARPSQGATPGDRSADNGDSAPRERSA